MAYACQPTVWSSFTAWKKIRDDVVACMAAIKATRIRIERQKVLSDRLAIFKTVICGARAAPPKRTAVDEYKPRFPDLAILPEVRAIVAQPNDIFVDQYSFEALLPNLPAWEQKWQDERTEELRQLLRDNSEIESRDGVDPLRLARTVFRCKRCRGSSYYPAVLAHNCRAFSAHCLPTLADGNGSRAPLDAYLYCVLDTYPMLPLQPHDFEVSPHTPDIDKIIALCGMDPTVVTHQEMDEGDFRLAYDGNKILGPTIMTWRRAVGWDRYCLLRTRRLTTPVCRSTTCMKLDSWFRQPLPSRLTAQGSPPNKKERPCGSAKRCERLNYSLRSRSGAAGTATFGCRAENPRSPM